MSYPLSNILLDSLPETSRNLITRHSRPVSLPVDTSLYERKELPKHVHFITSGIASIVTSVATGETVEVGTVGREGIPQGIHVLGPVPIATRCFMQIAGTGIRMDYGVFHDLFHTECAVRKATLAYAQYQTVLLGQIAGCNRLHDVEPRLARWFLMIQDRTASSTFSLTQEFVGQMIGSRRATVSTVAGSLQDRSLIRYARGRVTILDRDGLERVACDCYGATRQILASLYSFGSQSLKESKPQERPAAGQPVSRQEVAG